MNYGYIRVSSDKQTVENQRFEINNFCKKEGIIIDGWIEETISGANIPLSFLLIHAELTNSHLIELSCYPILGKSSDVTDDFIISSAQEHYFSLSNLT